MTHYDRLKRKRLGDILVDEGLATEEVVIAALQEQQETGCLLSDILIANNEVGEWDLARVIVEQYQTPFLDLKSYTIHKDLVEVFPALLLHQAAIVPLDRFGKQVCFACQEVPSAEIAAQLKQFSPSGFYVYIASALEIRQVLADYAPLSEAERKMVRVAAAGGPPPAAAPIAVSPEEDPAWKDLFDAANESILSELKPGSEG